MRYSLSRHCLCAVLLSTTLIAKDDVALLGPVADETPALPAPPKLLPSFQPTGMAATHRLDDHKIVMQQVANPGLPDPAPINDSQIAPLDEKTREALRASLVAQATLKGETKTRFLFLSATVYDHQRTLVRWYGSGTSPKSFAAWSNVDFNHISGIGAFQSNGVQYQLMMGIGNETESQTQKRAARAGVTAASPAVPQLPTDRPAYVLIEGDAGDAESLVPLDGLHWLYQKEKARLTAAYEGRERARIGHEAYLKAHPPVTPDTVIQFWPRKSGRSAISTTQSEVKQ